MDDPPPVRITVILSVRPVPGNQQAEIVLRDDTGEEIAGPVRVKVYPRQWGRLPRLMQKLQRTSDVDHLSAALFPDDIQRTLIDAVVREVAGRRRRVRVLIRLDVDATLQSIAWEYARFPMWRTDRFLETSEFLLVHDTVAVEHLMTPTNGAAPRTPRAWGDVLVTTATRVTGTLNGTPFSPAADAADGGLISTAVSDSGLRVTAPPEPLTPSDLCKHLSRSPYVWYFGGHHHDGGLVLAEGTSQRPVRMSGAAVVEAATAFGVDLVVLASCGAADTLQSPATLAARLVLAGVPYVVAFRTPVTHTQAQIFAEGFFSALREGHEIAEATAAGNSRRPDGPNAVVFSSLPVGSRYTPRVPAPVTDTGGFDVYRLLASSRSELGRIPVRERFRARLDVWCVRRGPLLAVVAGAGSAAAEGLTAVEHLVPYPAVRRWFTADVAGAPPPSVEALRRRLTDADGWHPELDGDQVGLVLRSRDRSGSDVKSWVDGTRQLLSRAAILVEVDAATRIDGVTEALAVARRLGLPEIFVRPVASDTSRTGRSETGPDVAGQIVQSLRGRWPAAAAGAAAAPRALSLSVDPTAAAVALTEQLNETDCWASGEELILAQIRDLLSELYPAVLEAHAKNRHWPARLASLRVACATDRELDSWIESSEWPEPRRGLLKPDEVVALVLALMRHHTDQRVVQQWLRYTDAPVLKELQSVWANHGRDEATFFHDASIDLALAGVRAGLGVGVRLTDIPNAKVRPGAWVLFARRGVTESDAAWLATLNHEPFRGLFDSAEAEELSAPHQDQLSHLMRALAPDLNTT